MWSISSTRDFDRWLLEQDQDAHVEILAKIELLKRMGPALGRPYADTLNGSKYHNMKELRAATTDKVFRVAFAFDPNRTGILLVAGNKAGVSSRQFYRQLIAKADSLYDIHLSKIKAARLQKEKP